jgi:YD repeat-containing protein
VDGKTTLSLAKYDLALEPLFEETAGARKVAYTREADGTRVATVTMPGDGQYVVRRSADGRKLSWRYPEGGSYALDAGQAVGVTRLLESGRLAAVWQAGPDGLLESATYETFAARPQYDSDGGLRTVLLTTPQSAKTFDRWLSVEYDEAGRVGVLRDYSGLGMQVTYDRTGEPTEFRSTRGAAKFVRDDQGRLQAVSTSWGFQLRNSYDASSGQLWSTAVEQGGATAVVEFENGMPTKVRQFNGGEFLIAYDKKGEGQLLVSSVKTPTHLRLTYEYDAQGRTTTVNCGRSYRLEYTYDDQGRLVRMVQAPLAAAGK